MKEQIKLGNQVGNRCRHVLQQLFVATQRLQVIVFNQIRQHHHGQGQVGDVIFVAGIPAIFVQEQAFHEAHAPVAQTIGLVGIGNQRAGQLQSRAMIKHGMNALLPSFQLLLEYLQLAGFNATGLNYEKSRKSVSVQRATRADSDGGEKAVGAMEVQAVFIGFAIEKVFQCIQGAGRQGVLFVHDVLQGVGADCSAASRRNVRFPA